MNAFTNIKDAGFVEEKDTKLKTTCRVYFCFVSILFVVVFPTPLTNTFVIIHYERSSAAKVSAFGEKSSLQWRILLPLAFAGSKIRFLLDSFVFLFLVICILCFGSVCCYAHNYERQKRKKDRILFRLYRRENSAKNKLLIAFGLCAVITNHVKNSFKFIIHF